ncbi:hypothetical protein [Pedobacter sp. Leaf170]|uniref:hypothetical protein n=1 Tax=Pedobacter sp. Leaf170 TaxID=2876558 RepID=UPI001E54BFEA|nr:hypothetical protein [Pedobacter sp. Leaf170]
MSKLEKTIKLSEATYEDVANFLNKEAFHAQNPTDSLRKCEHAESFNNWKNETMLNYPDATLIITSGADWFNEVRVSDPVFKEDKETFNQAKSTFLQTNFYGG